jgi:hypothetical protein
MQDNRKYLRERLGKLGVATHREKEIVRELSEHLADHAAALEAQGVEADAAVRQALDSVVDWPELRRQIVLAETEKATMNFRTKAVWLPALGALTLSNVLLALMQVFGPAPRLHWFGYVHGTWPYQIFFVPWLICQPAVGALAAYWSRRAGGELRHQVIAALAPSIALLSVFVLVIPVSIVLTARGLDHFSFVGFLLMTLIWVLVPSAPLLAGAAPFLRKTVAQS